MVTPAADVVGRYGKIAAALVSCGDYLREDAVMSRADVILPA